MTILEAVNEEAPRALSIGMMLKRGKAPTNLSSVLPLSQLYKQIIEVLAFKGLPSSQGEKTSTHTPQLWIKPDVLILSAFKVQ